MTLQEIKQALDDNKKVYWSSLAYQVIKDKKGEYLIKHYSGACIGLTWVDNVTLNGNEAEFFIH